MKYQMARTVVTIVVAIVFGVALVTSAAAQGRGRAGLLLQRALCLLHRRSAVGQNPRGRDLSWRRAGDQGRQ